VGEKFKINEHLVKMIQYHGWLLAQWPGQLSRRFKNMDSLRKIALGPWILLDSVTDSVGEVELSYTIRAAVRLLHSLASPSVGRKFQHERFMLNQF
jgi:hypothetical protein